MQRPTLQVWSDGDGYISRAAVDNNPRFVLAPYRLEVLPGVSHWIPDEAPGELARMVLAHIGSAPVPPAPRAPGDRRAG